MFTGSEWDIVPMCEDLPDGVLEEGDRCWSTCQGQCLGAVLKPGLVFDFDEISPGHPGCTNHFECIGNFDRILCHAVAGVTSANMFAAVEMPLG